MNASPPPLRVVVIHHGVVPGGAPVSLLHYLRAIQHDPRFEMVLLCHSAEMREFFRQRLERVRVAEFPDPCTELGKILTYGITPLEFKKARRLPALLRASRASSRAQEAVLREWRPDLIHLSSMVLYSTALAARRIGVPLVWQSREVVEGAVWSPRRLWFGSLIRRFSAGILAPTSAEASSMGLRPGDPRLLIMFHPVDIAELGAKDWTRERARRELGLPPDRPLVLTTGGSGYRKGLADLLRAWKLVPGDAILVVLGEPPRTARPPSFLARSLVRAENALIRLGLQEYPRVAYLDRINSMRSALSPDRILFAGFQKDISPWFAACDINLYGGVLAGYPRGIFDGWAFQKPCVAFDKPSIRECVENEADGLLVSFPDHAAIAAALESLLADPVLRESLGRKGYEKVCQQANPANIAARVANLYLNIAARSPVKPKTMDTPPMHHTQKPKRQTWKEKLARLLALGYRTETDMRPVTMSVESESMQTSAPRPRGNGNDLGRAPPTNDGNKAKLEEFRLESNDVAIDCGANIGDITERLAANGARVYAFEPNPHAFRVLQERFSDRPNVVCINKGVLDHPGTARLYFHQKAALDPVYWSFGSSLLKHKGNVNPETCAEIDLVDLTEFIRNLGTPVRLLKMDVEGVECQILTRLIKSGLARGIDRILVETHETKIPSLIPEVAALRRLIEAEELVNIDLDWH